MNITPEAIKTKIKHKFNYYRKKFQISNLTLAHRFILDANFRIFYDSLLGIKFDNFTDDLMIGKDKNKKFRVKLCDPFLKEDRDITVDYFLSKFHHTNIIIDQ